MIERVAQEIHNNNIAVLEEEKQAKQDKVVTFSTSAENPEKKNDQLESLNTALKEMEIRLQELKSASKKDILNQFYSALGLHDANIVNLY